LLYIKGAIPFVIRFCQIDDLRIQKNAVGTLLNLSQACISLFI